MALSERGKIVWFKELEKARQLVNAANSKAAGDEVPDYKIELDPEDFLDLCDGKWDIETEQLGERSCQKNALK